MKLLFFSLALVALLLALCLGTSCLAADPRGLPAGDALLNSPTLDLPQARRALDLYEEMLPQAEPTANPLWIRLARVCFILGDLAASGQRHRYYEKGRNYAEFLLREQPAGVEGHYWLGLNLCGLAEVGGSLKGRRLLPAILQELQRALILDESYDQAGPHRVLGRIYYEAPPWPLFVGDLEKSRHHLTVAARLAPENSTNHLYLAQTLLRLGQDNQARLELEQVLKASRHAIHPGGLQDDQRTARRLLGKMGGK